VYAHVIRVASERTARASGERALVLAVLLDAVRCLQGEHGRGRQRGRLIADARAWIASTDARWPFSFANVCHELGLDPDRLRPRLLRLAGALGSPARGPRGARPVHPREPEILGMIRAGHPLRAVAARFGLSVPRVSRLSHQLATRLKKDRDAEIRRQRWGGSSYRQIAARFGLSRIRVMQICRASVDPSPPAHVEPATELEAQTG
jgi:hypothetical protein